MAKNSLHIVPYPASAATEQDPLLATVEQKLSALLPDHIKDQIRRGDSSGILEALPVLGSTAGPSSLWLSFLSHWEYMGGVGRYVDGLCQGKTCLSSVSSDFPFHLKACQTIAFFSAQLFMISTQNLIWKLLSEI